MSSLRPRVFLLMNALLFLSACGEEGVAPPFNFWWARVAGFVSDSSGVAVPAFTVTIRTFHDKCLALNARGVQSSLIRNADGSFLMNVEDLSVGESSLACLVIVVEPEIEGLRTDSITGVLVRLRRTDNGAPDTAKVHVVLPPAAP